MARHMMACDEAGYLISKRLETEISIRKRMGLRIHLMSCHLCRKYEKQLKQLNLLVEDYKADCTHETCHCIPEERRESMTNAVETAMGEKG